MSTNQYFLSNDACTFKNAMTWGIFKEHCHQVKSGKLSNGAKCFHITMAALELFPILSQIVSLVELCFNKIFNSPKAHAEEETKRSPTDMGINPAHKARAGTFYLSLNRLLQDKEIGYYRNSASALNNLLKALDVYSQTGKLDEQFDATSAQGQGAHEQPNTVRETFEQAVNDTIHGGVIQTIDAMREANENLGLANELANIVDFLKTLNV